MTHSKKLLQTSSELLACAISDLFPLAQLMGTASFDHTFAAQFYFPYPADEPIIILIEERMRAISKDAGFSPKIVEMMPKNAAGMLRHFGQERMAEILEDIPSSIVSLIQMGPRYFNLAPAAWVQDLRSIHFKVLKLEAKGQIVKFIGTAATTSQELKLIVKGISAMRKGGVEKLGPDMRLIEKGGGQSLHPWKLAENGLILKELLSVFWRFEHRSQGFRLVASPQLVKNHFLFSMGEKPPIEGIEIDDEEYSLLSSFGVFHAAEYAKSPKNSQRLSELNSLFAPLSEVARNGLLHSQFFSSDQASIFCSENDLFHECISSLLFIDKTLRMLGFGYHWCFSAESKTFAGSKQRWIECAKAMRKALDETGLPYVEDDTEQEDGLLLTAHVVDSHGRPWVGPSIKIDLKLLKRLKGVNLVTDGVLMIQRQIFGSLERWIALLTEHYSGWFPLWLSPEQVRVLPYCHDDMGYATEVATALQNGGIRARSDVGREPIAQRIKLAERERVPYVVIVGEKEQSEQVLTVRSRQRSEITAKWHLGPFLEYLQREVITRQMPGKNV